MKFLVEKIDVCTVRATGRVLYRFDEGYWRVSVSDLAHECVEGLRNAWPDAEIRIVPPPEGPS